VPCAGVPAATPVQVLSSEGGQVTVAIPDLELRWPGCAAQPVQTSRSALRGF
jgi:hypothetical protein